MVGLILMIGALGGHILLTHVWLKFNNWCTGGPHFVNPGWLNFNDWGTGGPHFVNRLSAGFLRKVMHIVFHGFYLWELSA